MLNCVICSNKLKGKQTKFCSLPCKNASTNLKNQSYTNQRERGLDVKTKLIKLKGSCCSVCGYNKNYAGLCFHHLKDKNFQIDMRRCSNTKWEILVEEAEKCMLLCHNCHMEIHYPIYSII